MCARLRHIAFDYRATFTNESATHAIMTQQLQRNIPEKNAINMAIIIFYGNILIL